MTLYGSQANGLMLKGSSDIDVTITLPESKERNVLYNLLRSSMELPDCYKSDKVDFTKPVTFSTSFSEMSCLDITCKNNPALKREVQVLVNKHLEKYNVELIRTYTLVDARFKKLALILKYWNKMHIENSTQRLSSHAMVLMLICYLQIMGVLPKLQLLNVPD